MRRGLLCCVLLWCAAVLAPGTGASSDGAQADAVEALLDRADALVWLGVSHDGAGHSFEKALDLVDAAHARLDAGAGLPADRREELTHDADAIRRELELLIELYDDRFFGEFPLVRLTVPTLLRREGLWITEQLFHPPEVAACAAAARALMAKLQEYGHPSLVARSVTGDARMENLVLQVFMRAGRQRVTTRAELLRTLGSDALSAFDRGPLTPELVDRVMSAVDAASLVVVTVKPIVTIDERTMKVVLQGDLFMSGESVQGSPDSASLVVRAASPVGSGTVRDRREQFWPINVTQLVMLAIAMVWASRQSWSLGEPLRLFPRIAIGFVLFVFGRGFAITAVALMRKIVPESSALVSAAWWWPALLGFLVILGAGFVAWLAQARLTHILPGTRGARAVGSIFALTALGAGSFFVAPLLMFDGVAGFSSLVPFLAASLGLAVLFAFAARTGPPVPHYFMVGPLLVAPLVGVALLMASPGRLWATVGLTGLLCLAAWIRHRRAVARGTEEPERTPEEAAAVDQELLDNLAERLKKH